MLIRRDGLLAAPYPMAYNFEKLLSAGCGPPTAGFNMNPLQQRGRVRNDYVDQKKEEIMKKPLACKDQQPNWVSKKWLVA